MAVVLPVPGPAMTLIGLPLLAAMSNATPAKPSFQLMARPPHLLQQENSGVIHSVTTSQDSVLYMDKV